ncbi:MAG: hypothetical protein QM695_15975 [Micropruina sp.]
MITASPEVRQHADQQRRRHVTLKVRAWGVALAVGLAAWATALIALLIAIGVMGR